LWCCGHDRDGRAPNPRPSPPGALRQAASPKHQPRIQGAHHDEITLVGHVGRDIRLNPGRDGAVAVLGFSIAINDRQFDRRKSEWVDRPTVWQDVVAFGARAENAYDTLTRGMAVIVVGKLADNSYTRDDDTLIRRCAAVRDTAASWSPTCSSAHCRARSVSTARDPIASCRSVHVFLAHSSRGQHQIRFHQHGTTGRPASGRSRTHLGLRSFALAERFRAGRARESQCADQG